MEKLNSIVIYVLKCELFSQEILTVNNIQIEEFQYNSTVNKIVEDSKCSEIIFSVLIEKNKLERERGPDIDCKYRKDYYSANTNDGGCYRNAGGYLEDDEQSSGTSIANDANETGRRLVVLKKKRRTRAYKE